MIYIWDNGEAYSDHEIRFVRDDGWPREVVEAVFASRRLGQRDAFIMGVADNIEWREKNATCPLWTMVAFDKSWPDGVPYRVMPLEHLEKCAESSREWRDHALTDRQRAIYESNAQRYEAYIAAWKAEQKCGGVNIV